MDKRKEKSFIRTNAIICIITMLTIGVVSYLSLMREMKWWQLMIYLLAIIVCSFAFNVLNLILHTRKRGK